MTPVQIEKLQQILSMCIVLNVNHDHELTWQWESVKGIVRIFSVNKGSNVGGYIDADLFSDKSLNRCIDILTDWIYGKGLVNPEGENHEMH